MKILVVTNLYPPQHIGGYELGCRDVVEKLCARGHNVRVLTSNFHDGRTETPPGETDVERVLRVVREVTGDLPPLNESATKPAVRARPLVVSDERHARAS